MLRRLLILVSAFCLVFLGAVPAYADDALTPNDPTPQNPVIVSEIYPDAPSEIDNAPITEKDPVHGEFIELHNPSNEDMPLSGFRLRIITTSSGSSYDVVFTDETIDPLGYIAIRDVDETIDFSLANSGATVELWYDNENFKFLLFSITYTPLDSSYSWSLIGDEWQAATPSPGAENTPLPAQQETVGNEPPVNECGGARFSEIGANLDTDQQFIEIHNPTDKPIDLAGCMLQTNRSTTRSHVFGDQIIASGGYQEVYIRDTELILTKTTSGTVYLLSSDGLIEAASQAYSNLNKETSWAWFGADDWRQTYSLTPGKANAWQEFQPCPAGQFRNPETGRCKNVVETAAQLMPCGPGRERNPETNRCRNIGASASTLTPCKPGQERNPETNRCRKIAAAAGSLKPCAEDEERNPETNRCRKVAGSVAGASSFASATTPSELHNGALVFVAIAALAFGFYEYRLDLANWLDKLRRKEQL